MGMTLGKVVNAVQNQSFYPELFKKAFGSNEINSDKISKAIRFPMTQLITISSLKKNLEDKSQKKFVQVLG
jgi:cytochrome c peroxidase